MNLSTAKSVERAKEIGVRKTLGAAPHHLSFQFLAESVMLAMAAMALAILIVEVSLPSFNFLTGLSFDIVYTRDGLIFLMLGIFIGVAAGVYPSLHLSKVRPHLILKGKVISTPGRSAFRRALIVFQFFISMMLISSAMIINQQLGFLSSKNLGFEKEAMLIIPIKDESGMDRFHALQTELLEIRGVASFGQF
jgi:putative ABC transport system permease protein